MTEFNGSVPAAHVEHARAFAEQHSAAIVKRMFYVGEKEMPCVWIWHGDQQVAWFQIKDKMWLEVALEPDNWPGASAHLAWWERDIFRQHLLMHCEGWHIRENRGVEYLQDLGVVQDGMHGLEIGDPD